MHQTIAIKLNFQKKKKKNLTFFRWSGCIFLNNSRNPTNPSINPNRVIQIDKSVEFRNSAAFTPTSSATDGERTVPVPPNPLQIVQNWYYYNHVILILHKLSLNKNHRNGFNISTKIPPKNKTLNLKIQNCKNSGMG